MHLTEQEKRLVTYFRAVKEVYEGREFTILVGGVPFGGDHVVQVMHGLVLKPTALSLKMYELMEEMKSGPSQKTIRYLISHDPAEETKALVFTHDPDFAGSDRQADLSSSESLR